MDGGMHEIRRSMLRIGRVESGGRIDQARWHTRHVVVVVLNEW